MDKRYKTVQSSNPVCTDIGAPHVCHDGCPGSGRDLGHLLDSLSAANKVVFVENLEKVIAFLTNPKHIPLDRPEPKGNDFEKEITKKAIKLLWLPHSTGLSQGNHDLNGVRTVEDALTTHGAAASASRDSIDVLHEFHDRSGAHAAKSPLATCGAAGLAFCKAVGWPLPDKIPETRLDKNPQVEVPVDEVKPGGPFRGIVRIVAVFPNRVEAHGTGFLVDHDVVTTCGHLLSNDHGCALKVSLFAGTGGPESTIARREGDWVAVHSNWFHQDTLRDSNDIGFVHLSEIFSTVKPLDYTTTPASDGHLTGAVYGYPGYFPAHAPGKRLCISTSPLWFPDEASLVLEHEADTEAGNSGGPIIDVKGRVIAIHAGCNKGRTMNEAVAVNRNGNDFDIFIRIAKFLALCGRDRAGLITPADDAILEDGQHITIERVVNVPNIGNGVAFKW